MSRIISFRLDEADPREAQALALIDAAQGQGHALRTVITEAILSYANQIDHGAETHLLVAELRAALADVTRLAETVQRAPSQPALPQSTDDEGGLPDVFVAAVQRGVRPGRRLE